MIAVFLSTPSARRATARGKSGPAVWLISIHALREEGDHARSSFGCWQVLFLSTPSARRATDFLLLALSVKAISIHALREEGDGRITSCAGCWGNFYPRPPRGGRLDFLRLARVSLSFLSTPSARRAT